MFARIARRSFLALACVVLSTAGLTGGVVHSAPRQTVIPSKSQGTPNGGWTSANGTMLKVARNGSTPYVIGGGGSSNCPSGTTGYSNQAWNCVQVVPDLYNHAVWIRYGYSGGFGYLHFYQDHNLDLSTVETVIELNPGYYQQSSGRYEYLEGHRNSQGAVDQWVYVYEQRTKGNGSPDNYEFGVVTAFCTTGSGVEEATCPDWVNETL